MSTGGHDPEALKLKQMVDELKKEIEDEKKAWEALGQKVSKARIIQFEMEGYVKKYKDTCMNSDSLTTLRPSVVKELNDLDAMPTKALRDKAVAALKKHLDEITNNKSLDIKGKLKKEYDGFKKDIEELIAGLKKQNEIPS